MNEEIVNDRPHPTVVVEVGDFREEIDVEIAELIELIWKAGVETFMSCQGTDTAWIEFMSPDDFIRFLHIVAWYDEDPESLYARVNWLRGPLTEGHHWEYQFNLLDIMEGQDEQTVDGMWLFMPTVGVRFPKSDISILVERLQPLTPEPALPTEPQVSQPS